MTLSYDITAVITCLPTEESGRTKPFVSGYRSQFFYENHDWDVQHLYRMTEPVAPGQIAVADLKFLSPEYQVGRLYVGKAFQIREGQRTIGQGYVQAITGLVASAKQRADQLKLRHFKRDWLETRGDAFAVWARRRIISHAVKMACQFISSKYMRTVSYWSMMIYTQPMNWECWLISR